MEHPELVVPYIYGIIESMSSKEFRPHISPKYIYVGELKCFREKVKQFKIYIAVIWPDFLLSWQSTDMITFFGGVTSINNC